MQVINPNINIGFKQIQANKKLNKKEPLVINNSPLVRSGLASSCILGFSSMLFLDVSLSDLKKDILKNKMLYFLFRRCFSEYYYATRFTRKIKGIQFR